MSVSVDTVMAAVDIVAHDAAAQDADKRWPQAERLQWLLEGATILCVDRNDAKVKRATVTLAQGAKQALPSDAIALLDMRTPYGPVLPCSKVALDAFNPRWQTTGVSNRVVNYMYDPAEHPTFWVVSPQSSAPASVELVYKAYPTIENGVVDVQAKYESHLINYLLYRMFSKDAEVGSAERAAAYLQLFKG